MVECHFLENADNGTNATERVKKKYYLQLSKMVRVLPNARYDNNGGTANIRSVYAWPG